MYDSWFNTCEISQDDDFWTSLKMIRIESKTRSACQIIKQPCILVYHRSNIFSPVLLEDSKNICLDMLNEFENRSC